MAMQFQLTNAQMRVARESRDKRFDGLFFIGVISTGIFCRPICSARLPREENINYYPNAALALDAGFRPCKLCKPDAAPPHKHNRMGDDILERCIAIMHVRPDVSIEVLATEMGLSTRRLGQKFNDAMGLAPTQYLRKTTSTHSLTRLPGNSSVDENSTVDTQLFLAYRPPYLWEPLRDFLAIRAIPDIEEVTATCYSRCFTINGQPGRVAAHHNAEKCGFDVVISVQQPNHIKPALETLSRVLDCDANWFTIEHSLEQAGVEVTKEIKGLRLPGVWDVFEAGCRAIFGQQVSVAGAITKTKQFVEAVRNVSPGTGFPAPNEVTAEIVEKLGMPRTRKDTLIRFAEHMSKSNCYADVQQGKIADLLALKGIGPWTCQYILMRGTSHPDIWIATDLAILKQCERLCEKQGEKHALNPELAKPWSSYLTLALWQDYFDNK